MKEFFTMNILPPESAKNERGIFSPPYYTMISARDVITRASRFGEPVQLSIPILKKRTLVEIPLAGERAADGDIDGRERLERVKI